MAPARRSTSIVSELFQLPPHLHNLPRGLAFALPSAWKPLSKRLTQLVRTHSSSFSSKPSQRGPPGQCAVRSPPHLLPQRLVLGLCVWVSTAWQPHALYLGILLLRTGPHSGRKRRQPGRSLFHSSTHLCRSPSPCVSICRLMSHSLRQGIRTQQRSPTQAPGPCGAGWHPHHLLHPPELPGPPPD